MSTELSAKARHCQNTDRKIIESYVKPKLNKQAIIQLLLLYSVKTDFTENCYGLSLLPSIICLGRFCIACKGVNSLVSG